MVCASEQVAIIDKEIYADSLKISKDMALIFVTPKKKLIRKIYV